VPPRIQPLPIDERPPEVAELPDLNIFGTLARHPKLTSRWARFGGWLLARGTLPARERELAILRTGFRCGSEYEFGQHVQIGLDAGVTQEEVDRIVLDPATAGWSDDDAVLLRAVDELHDDSRIGDATWSALAQRFDDQQLIELCMLVGQYHLVAMTLNSLGVERDPGVPGFPGS
jgi:4-carboxymuconolactone decarboxylase